jgi:putative transposase
MDPSELKRMRELEEENVKLKKMFADVSLQNQAMKELFAKKGW